MRLNNDYWPHYRRNFYGLFIYIMFRWCWRSNGSLIAINDHCCDCFNAFDTEEKKKWRRYVIPNQ